MKRLKRWTAKLWPICDHCKQSMTGAYAGRPSCFRCSNGRWLTADRPLPR